MRSSVKGLFVQPGGEVCSIFLQHKMQEDGKFCRLFARFL